MTDRKKIELHGKQTIHTLLHGGTQIKATRAVMQDRTDVLPSGKFQLDLIIQLYMAVPVAVSNHELQFLLEREIHKKIHGYKSQDLKKELHLQSSLITYMEVIEKLVASQLKCAYCTQPVFVLYKDVRDPTQWTLDRKDNDLGHSQDNTVICCLKCNLQRRRIDDDKFMFTKRMKICKIDR